MGFGLGLGMGLGWDGAAVVFTVPFRCHDTAKVERSALEQVVRLCSFASGALYVLQPKNLNIDEKRKSKPSSEIGDEKEGENSTSEWGWLLAGGAASRRD